MPDLTVRVDAPAKLNLFLRVVGRRPDGFHDLDSLVAFAESGDRLALTLEARPAFSATGPFAADLPGDPEANLAVRAVAMLAERLGRRPNVAIRLEKNLPVASGIGGGSADAAAALCGAARLWQIDSRPLLMDVAAALGSDVPACFVGRPARIAGRGERVSPVEALPGAAVVLVNPGVPLATAAVFRERRGPWSAPAPAVPAGFAGAAALAAWLRPLGNDLAAPAARLLPAVRAAVAALAAEPGCLLARLSGSGATCFGLFESALAAAQAAAAIGRTHPAWWVEATRLADRVAAAGPPP